MKDFLDYLLKTWNCSSYKIDQYGVIFYPNIVEKFYLRLYPNQELVSFEDNSYEEFYEKTKTKSFLFYTIDINTLKLQTLSR